MTDRFRRLATCPTAEMNAQGEPTACEVKVARRRKRSVIVESLSWAAVVASL